MDNEQGQFEEPADGDKELAAWVMEHCNSWRDYRDTNFLPLWQEYERIFRGQWAAEDKTRESERSRIITPATQQAVETRHAEIMEAVFGQGEFFDISDDIRDVNGSPLDVMALKAQMHEDFKRDKVRKNVDQIVLLGEVYGTGIGEIIVKEVDEFTPATQPIPGLQGQAAIGVMEGKRMSVQPRPVNPKNFLIDPNADCIEDALGCAIEKFTSIHKIVEGMESGLYKKVQTGTLYTDNKLEPTQEETNYQENKVTLLTYYGLVPSELLYGKEEKVELFPEHSAEDKYDSMVEAIIVVANGSVVLKAEENPYMMKDRPVVAYQADTVPGRFWGRGTVEKAYNMQKAIDGQLRAHLDSLALTTAPMVAMDATRLPRGAKFEVKPGKSLLTNGNPAEIIFPFHFGQTNQDAPAAAQNFERMLLQATGTVDSAGMPSAAPRDANAGGMSMAMAGIIKKYKRTLTNFQEDFLIPFINKAAHRFMQFDPERYPSVDVKFVPTATLGVLAREFEQQQLIALLQTLGPDTPVLPVLLQGIITNSSLSNKGQILEALQKMSQKSPEQEQMAQMQQQLAMQTQQAQAALVQAQAAKAQAEAMLAQVSAQLKPKEVEAKIVSALSNNLDDDNEGKDFERRAKIAELMFKEQEINLKKMDIESNERIAKEQMAAKNKADSTFKQTLED